MEAAAKVDVPGVGPVNKTVLYVIGGTAVAFVGWKWWQARKNAAAAVPQLDTTTGSTGATDYANPHPVNTGGNPSANPAPTNNQEWVADVLAKFANNGTDPNSVQVVLGKYLASQGLTAEEIAIVQQAWALSGKPPQGPAMYVTATGGGSTPANDPGTRDAFKITDLHVTSVERNKFSVAWTAPPGTVWYTSFLRGPGGQSTGGSATNGTTRTFDNLQPGTHYNVLVYASNGGSTVRGPDATLDVTTAS